MMREGKRWEERNLTRKNSIERVGRLCGKALSILLKEVCQAGSIGGAMNDLILKGVMN